MKIGRIIGVVFLLFNFAACTRRSSNPEKDKIGAWQGPGVSRQAASIVFLELKDNGRCSFQEYVSPGIASCSYRLNIDPSGNDTITISTTVTSPMDTRTGSRTYPIEVYENELVVGGSSLSRVSKSPPR
jgi:hypothetical protein